MTKGKNQRKGGFSKKKEKILIVVLLLILAVGIAVVMALSMKKKDSDIEKEKENKKSEAAAEEKEKTEIKTPVGTLVFPEEWDQDVQIEDTSSEDRYSVSFYGKVGSDKVFLFEISIGEKGSGYQLGSAPDEDGKKQLLWLNISEIVSDSSWSEEEVSYINTLQSCVNDLIDQFYQMKGFENS